MHTYIQTDGHQRLQSSLATKKYQSIPGRVGIQILLTVDLISQYSKYNFNKNFALAKMFINYFKKKKSVLKSYNHNKVEGKETES